jgi:subtilase family protein
MGQQRFARDQPVIRILARPPARMATRALSSIVTAALANTRWGRDSASRARLIGAAANGVAANDLLIEVAVTAKIGSPRYATHAHDLVQRLYDTNEFLRVEADVPVGAFERRAKPSGPGRASGGSAACGQDSSSIEWVREELNVDAALALLPAGSANGKGVVIGHPDSGYSDHGALGSSNLDLGIDRDVISDDDDARDPLRPPKKSFWNALPNPGHGTSTASVMVGNGDVSGFQGIAVGAKLVPIRATESVVQVFDFDVAKAVRWANKVGCDVVSMSLGGKGLFGLQDAIQEAVDNGMIVMAAAGNNVGFVTAPASYDNCIAVAATGPGSKTWAGSSRGEAVDFSAPGSCVWCAQVDWKTKPPGFVVTQSHGTSYAVAHLAGVASLWLALHGRHKLASTYGRQNVQALLLHVLRQPGVCRRPAGWNSAKWGAGIVDAERVLRQALPAPHALGGPGAFGHGAPDDPLERLAASAARSPATIAIWVNRVLGPGSSTDRELLRRFEGELAYHVASTSIQVAPSRAVGPSAAKPGSPPGASPQLAARLKRTSQG